jgi:hypothetical protein
LNIDSIDAFATLHLVILPNIAFKPDEFHYGQPQILKMAQRELYVGLTSGVQKSSLAGHYWQP